MTDSETNQQEMDNLKAGIQELIASGKFAEAESRLDASSVFLIEDGDFYALKANINILKGELDAARQVIETGLRYENDNVNLLFCMGAVFERRQQYDQALNFYQKALDLSSAGVAYKIQNQIKNIQNNHQQSLAVKKPKLAFLVRAEMDHFLSDIMSGLSQEYETQKFVITELPQIDSALQWADICWFEWCDELIVYGSKNASAGQKTIICRLHHREVFENHASQVAWENVDKLVVVSDHLKTLLQQRFSDIQEVVDITTVPNGVDLERFRYSNRQPGYNLAYVCNLDARKNPVLALQIIKKLTGIDQRYKLFVAGKFVDPLIEDYWNYQIKAMQLEENVVFQGWQNSMDDWLQDKHYLVSTSLHESFGYNIAEAMAKGIKPVIHDFIFARGSWPAEFLFNTVDEALQMVTAAAYDSQRYRRHIEENFSLTTQTNHLRELLHTLAPAYPGVSRCLEEMGRANCSQ